MSSCQPRREAGQGFALYTSCDIGAERFLRAWGLIVAEISIIDYGPYFAGARGALEGVAADVARACENVGFFYALNHGVSDDTIPLPRRVGAAPCRLSKSSRSGWTTTIWATWRSTPRYRAPRPCTSNPAARPACRHNGLFRRIARNVPPDAPALCRGARPVPDYFAPYFANEAHANLRFLHYPPQDTLKTIRSVRRRISTTAS